MVKGEPTCSWGSMLVLSLRGKLSLVTVFLKNDLFTIVDNSLKCNASQMQVKG